jgi:hypothetical protein
MLQRNRAGQDVRAGDVFVECIEKKGVRDFGFCAQGESPVWQDRKRLPEEECGSQEQRMAVRLILNETWKSKMEIPAKGTLEHFPPTQQKGQLRRPQTEGG